MRDINYAEVSKIRCPCFLAHRPGSPGFVVLIWGIVFIPSLSRKVIVPDFLEEGIEIINVRSQYSINDAVVYLILTMNENIPGASHWNHKCKVFTAQKPGLSKDNEDSFIVFRLFETFA